MPRKGLTTSARRATCVEALMTGCGRKGRRFVNSMNARWTGCFSFKKTQDVGVGCRDQESAPMRGWNYLMERAFLRCDKGSKRQWAKR